MRDEEKWSTKKNLKKKKKEENQEIVEENRAYRIGKDILITLPIIDENQ